MKILDTQFIVSGVKQPIKKGTLDHLQSAYKEDELDILQMVNSQGDSDSIASYSIPVILYGCRWLSGIGAVSVGAVVYNSEIFRAPAVVGITLGFGQVVVGTITTTYLTATDADPVEFSDASLNNVHEIRQIVWSAGASGSGDFDLDSCLLYGKWNTIPYSASYLTAPTGTWTVGSSNFNVKWTQQGRKITINFDIQSSTITGTPAYLILRLPFNAKFKDYMYSVCFWQNIGNSIDYGMARVVSTDGTNDLRIYTVGPATWVAQAGANMVQGEITCELAKADT